MKYSLSKYVQMALSAASPFYRGYVSDIDCRWGVISASVDDRTREERGLEVRSRSIHLNLSVSQVFCEVPHEVFVPCDHYLQPLKNNKFRIHKSRYDSIDSYLSFCGEKYNDIELTIDDEIYNQLLDAGKKESRVFALICWYVDIRKHFCLWNKSYLSTLSYISGIDKLLAQHIAHLFIRDPLSLFEEKIHLDDENESDHFEVLGVKFHCKLLLCFLLKVVFIFSYTGILSFYLLFCPLQNLQSTNWQTMRFKPPPPNSDIGWRVEFRPMEVWGSSKCFQNSHLTNI